MADNEGNGDKDDAPPDQPTGPLQEVGEEVELQSQLSESGSIQDSDVANNPRGVSFSYIIKYHRFVSALTSGEYILNIVKISVVGRASANST